MGRPKSNKRDRLTRERRRQEAQARQELRNQRNDEQQVDLLKTRPGNSAKELARLS